MGNSGITANYFELTSQGCMQAIMKLINATDYMSGEAKYEVTKMFREFKIAKKAIQAAYEENIVETFAKKDEQGNKIPEDPAGMNPEGFNLDETKMEEFKKAKEEFGKGQILLECRPLSVKLVSNVKDITPLDMDALGVLITDQETK